MNFTFFGTAEDVAAIWNWMFEVPGMRIFEQFSRDDKPNRWFDTWESISDYLRDRGTSSLAAWPEFVGGRPRPEKIRYTREVRQEFGVKGRTDFWSPAIIGINSNVDQNGCLASSCLSCWNEKGARARSIYGEKSIDDVDWRALRSVTGKITRAITKSAPAKMRSYPIMPDAFARLEAGQQSLWNWGEEVRIGSPLITLR
jgi:hypothetical protein